MPALSAKQDWWREKILAARAGLSGWARGSAELIGAGKNVVNKNIFKVLIK